LLAAFAPASFIAILKRKSRDIVVEEVARRSRRQPATVPGREKERGNGRRDTTTADSKSDTPNAIEKAKKKPAEAAGDETVDEAKAKKKPVGDDADEDAATEKARPSAEEEEDEDDDDQDKPTKKARKQELVLAAPVQEALLRVLTDALETAPGARALPDARGAPGRALRARRRSGRLATVCAARGGRVPQMWPSRARLPARRLRAVRLREARRLLL
jgi:hypothetical protein